MVEGAAAAAVEVRLKMKDSEVLEVEAAAAAAAVGEEQEGPLKSAQVEEAEAEEAVVAAVARLHCSAMSATLVRSTQAVVVGEAAATSASPCCLFSTKAKAVVTPASLEWLAGEAVVVPSA